MVEREQAHHDAGRAEAALRSMEVDHRLLDGMQTRALGEVLDRQHLGAVDLAEQQDAGVDRLVGRRAIGAAARQDDCAGAAIALAAALLGALGADVLAQPVEERRTRRKTVERNSFAAKAESQTLAGPRPGCACRHSRLNPSSAHHGFFCAATEAASWPPALPARSTADKEAGSRARRPRNRRGGARRRPKRR